MDGTFSQAVAYRCEYLLLRWGPMSLQPPYLAPFGVPCDRRSIVTRHTAQAQNSGFSLDIHADSHTTAKDIGLLA
jgi:hypothetical protein